MKRILSGLILLAVLGLSSCKPRTRTPDAEPPAQNFTVRGVLRSIDFAGRSVTVEHEDIPNYMPAMTMPFDVRAMDEVEPLKAGDAIEFQLVVTAKSSWMEGVKKIDPRDIQLPEKKSSGGSDGRNVSRVKEGDPLPPFKLLDSKGRTITRETFAGKPLLLTFIFTRCPLPNFCPLMMNHFREINESLAAIPGRAAGLQFLSISFDSGFDSPEVLREYAARYTQDSDRWRFASGTPDETTRLTQAFSVAVQPEAGTISHGLATALVGSDGTIRHIWRGNGWKPSEVLQALGEL